MGEAAGVLPRRRNFSSGNVSLVVKHFEEALLTCKIRRE
jgi:hypothetical protein